MKTIPITVFLAQKNREALQRQTTGVGALKFSLLLFAAILIVACVSSCSQYPDGPIISVRSKAARVANNWKVAQALDDGKDVTSNYSKYELTLSEAGAASISAKYTILGADFEYVTGGTWAFVNDADKISFDFENNDQDGVHTILKLQEKEMWLKEDGGTVELHYVTK